MGTMFKFIKKLLLIVLVVGFGFFLWLNFDKSEESIQKKLGLGDVVSTPFTSRNYIDLKFNDKELRAVWFKVNDPKDLLLLSNFEEQLTLEQIIEEWDCKNISNGGFYDEDNSPIGLFISEEEVLSNATRNILFNGYFSVTKSGDVSIGTTYPDSLRIGLQTGPILIKNKIVQKLNLQNDKAARRTIAALDKESVFQGPLLADLPEIIEKTQDEIGIEFTDAINLDGGSASAFYTGGKKLSELTFVGSFFCVK